MTLSDKLYNKTQLLKRRLGIRGPQRYDIEGLLNPDIPPEEKTRSPVHEAFYSNTGSLVHKWQHYLPIYDRHLSRYRGTRVRFLEIGVFRGGSLRMWRKYFGDQATLFGIDVDPRCRRYDGESGSVRIGSQADAEFLRRVVDEMGGVDVVLDDGSHIANHQNASFDVLFPLVSPQGTYLCEDTHTAYWRGGYEGGYRRRSTFIERCKLLIDDIHAEFHDKPSSVPDAHRSISGIHFYNSIIAIEKAPQSPSRSIKIGTDKE